MSTPQERVLEMMASGQVSREEAERLLAALERTAPRQRWYLDPVAALSTTAATSVALGITCYSWSPSWCACVSTARWMYT
ncbi:MAG: hypothetical protein KC766_25965 [Myxococcales bacterium]|nr:hypothetical protein [Myxococcales bacterium]